MSIANYTDLQAAVVNWTHREGDTAFAAIIPDLVKLAEARFNRALRVSDMEEAMAETSLSSGEATLPENFLAFKELRFVGDANYTLQPKTLEWIRAQPTDSGNARYFAVSKSTVVCWPTTGNIQGTYYRTIPDLASNSTNWLLTDHPDLYLFATLTESALYEQDDTRIPLWASKAQALLEAVQTVDDKSLLDGGPLSMRAR